MTVDMGFQRSELRVAGAVEVVMRVVVGRICSEIVKVGRRVRARLDVERRIMMVVYVYQWYCGRSVPVPGGLLVDGV